MADPHVIRDDLGISAGASPSVDVKVMASLLSMDAYVVLGAYGGTAAVREVQRWLNGTYGARRDFALVPCDGVHSRSVQTALLLALQYELGMADGVANGNFGPGTKTALRARPALVVGSRDSNRRLVTLFHAAMILNGLPVPLDSSFTSASRSTILEFQAFMEIPETGRGDCTTWCNLLVSCGDTDIATTGLDTNRWLRNGMAARAVARGYTHVGRYLVGRDKYIASGELVELRDAGLLLIPIFQRYNDSSSSMTRELGREHALEALVRCRVLGIPHGSTVFFAVDYDAIGRAITGGVFNYFTGINEVIAAAPSRTIAVGVYGTRNVCRLLMAEGLATAAYVSGMSTGYSGNMGFPMPQDWHYNQIVETTEDLGQASPTPIDKVVVSRRASAVDLSGVPGPPLEQEGASSETGFSVLFMWWQEASVRCEMALSPLASQDGGIYASDPAPFILNWLRKPTYWGSASNGMWLAYTPEPPDRASQAALRVCEAVLGGQMRPLRARSDVAHWAVSTLAYSGYGADLPVDDYGFGDLGAWALDLYSLFGAWQERGQGADLGAWAFERLGSRSDDSPFGRNDLLADVDAWLMSSTSAPDLGSSFSDRMRSVLSMSPDQRLAQFYSGRFGSSPSNVDAAFAGLANGLDMGAFEDSGGTLTALRRAAGFDEPPTQVERAALTSAFARRLEKGLPD